MLNPQVAEERLKEFATLNPLEKQKARIALLPENLRVAALAVLGCQPDGSVFVTETGWSNWDKRQEQEAERNKAQDAAYRVLDAVGSAEREAVFAAFAPRLAPLLAHCWKPTQPFLYQSGYERRPFRLQPDADREELQQKQRSTFYFYLLNNGVSTYQEMPVEWFAAWVPYLGADISHSWGPLFAAAIDRGGAEGDAVFDILLASGRGEHEIGAMGRHVTRGLLSASRPEGWDWVEKLLLAAQRQEGLRQAVLEVADEAHPEAFRRMLRVIRENDLFRFSATVRAADVWFGMNWNAYEKLSVKQANAACEMVETFLANPKQRDTVLATSDDGQTVYLALWSLAFNDAHAALRAALPLLSDTLVARRYAALHLLTELRLSEAKPVVLVALDDADLRIAQKAYNATNWYEGNGGMGSTSALAAMLGERSIYLTEILESGPAPDSALADLLSQIKESIATTLDAISATTKESGLEPTPDLDDRFERLERNLPRFPARPKELEPVIWEWDKQTAHQETLADAMPRVIGPRPAERLLPYLSLMSSYGRSRTANTIGQQNEKTGVLREALLELVGDSASSVREAAFKAISTFPLADEETGRIEGLLTRKASDLRKSALSLLIKRDDAKVIESGERLTSAKDANQRMAGLDLMTQMIEKKRRVEQARSVVTRFSDARGDKLTEPEKRMIEPLLRESHEKATLDDALGLMDPVHLTRVLAPPLPKAWPLFVSPATLQIVQALSALVETHREAPITVQTGGGDKSEMLLGNVEWRFPVPERGAVWEQEAEKLPLRDVWEAFWDRRSEALRDTDGLELSRVIVLMGTPGFPEYLVKCDSVPTVLREQLTPCYDGREEFQVKHRNVIHRLVFWLLLREQASILTPRLTDFLLDTAEASLVLAASRTSSDKDTHEDEDEDTVKDWRDDARATVWLGQARRHLHEHPELWTGEQRAGLYRLLFWMERPEGMLPRRVVELAEMIGAFREGFANRDDMYNLLLGPRLKFNHWGTESFAQLKQISGRKVAEFDTYPELRPFVEKARDAILKTELRRAESETAASEAALMLRYSGGADTLLPLLGALGKETFARGYSYYGVRNRSNVFSRLVRASFPGETDTPEAFAIAAKAANLPDKQLIETAVYAPQWARHVEHTLNLPGLTDAVWWLHAHTKDNSWSVATDIREAWTAEIADKTPLSAADLTEGAVDVQWFGQVYETLGEAHWKLLDDAAKYASSAGGHKRAQLFADAMLGRLNRSELLTRIKEKRHQDSLRALGLLPLAEAGADRDADVLERYKSMQEFLRTSKQFGAQRQESEKLAVRIGMENLARTAGYPDPIRLTWAMEASAVADLKDGPVVQTIGDVTVTLSINPLGLPDLTVVKKGKALANLPPAVKKQSDVAELVARKTDLTRQVTRMRESLESAMCRGDRFTGREVGELREHPLLRPLLHNLVFIEADGKEPILGYPIGDGQLEDCNGEKVTVTDDTSLRIAHPYDLLHTKHWDRWQRDCFLRERVQPFKQVFRELYVLTEAEKVDATRSQRYAGHQVNPKQALALFNKRGWVGGGEYDYDGEGPRKTFHEDGYTVSVGFMGWTGSPADVEGSTIEEVRFARKGEWKPVALETVPPRVFSEAMRDLDLVVSVAHVGGVDPEASQSTTEMRAALTREAMALLKITNVRFEKSHAIIDGKLSTYDVHLGSGVVHRQPGGYLCIVPVHSQHRGRLFLPFADDDPRTAEVISKVLLLARDSEIKDPTILEQILSVR